MSVSLKPYVDLLARTGQIEHLSLDDESLLTRGFCVFLGFLLGLMVAFWLGR